MANIAYVDPFDLLEGVIRSVRQPGSEQGATPRRNGWNKSATISIDVAESDQAFIVWADLPGVRKEDVTVSILGNQLSLSAELKRENAIDQGQGKEVFVCNERPNGVVTRQLQFPAEIDDSRAAAQFRDGVLQLTLPKKESAKVKRISIQ